MKLRDFINQCTHPLGTTLKKNSFGDDWKRDAFNLRDRDEDWLIIDAGAHRGETLEQLFRKLPKARYHAFEPAPETFQLLEKNWGAFPNIEIHSNALGSTSGSCTFYTHPDSATNSLFPTTDASVSAKAIEVEQIRLDDWAERRGIDSIHLLKMDCQGAELQILQGAEALLREKKIQMIYTEVLFTPLYQGQCYFDEIVAFLRKNGLQLVALYDGRRHEEGPLLWSNALFSG